MVKRNVYIAVTFLKVGEVNTLKEQFEADVLITAKWRETALDKNIMQCLTRIDWRKYWTPNLYIENVKGELKETSSRALVHDVTGDAYVIETWRLKGIFAETLELWEFPFDVQDLSVTIISDLPATEIDLCDDPGEPHKLNKPVFVAEQEWHLYTFVESVNRQVSKYVTDADLTKTAMSVKCVTARRPAYFLWNMFMITFLIVSLSLLTFTVDAALPQNRLQLAFTLILTSVAFKFTVNQSLPRISYLTYLDEYVLMAMSMLALVCFWHGLQVFLPKEMNPVKEYIAVGIAGLIYVSYNVFFWLRIFTRPYKTRRQLAKKEKHYLERINLYLERKKFEQQENKLEEVKIAVEAYPRRHSMAPAGMRAAALLHK